MRVTPKDWIWSSVALRVDAESNSRGASKVTPWREDAPAAGAHANRAMSRRSRRIRRVGGERRRWGGGPGSQTAPRDVQAGCALGPHFQVPTRVDPQAQAAALEQPPLLVRRPLE